MPRLSKPDPYLAAVGARIRELREERGITLEGLALDCGYDSKGHFSGIETGRVSPPLELLRRIAVRFGLSVSKLIDVPLGLPIAADRQTRYEPTPKKRRGRPRR